MSRVCCVHVFLVIIITTWSSITATNKRMNGEKEINRLVMESYLKGELTKIGCKKRMKRFGNEKHILVISEQRLADQTRVIKK